MKKLGMVLLALVTSSSAFAEEKLLQLMSPDTSYGKIYCVAAKVAEKQFLTISHCLGDSKELYILKNGKYESLSIIKQQSANSAWLVEVSNTLNEYTKYSIAPDDRAPNQPPSYSIYKDDYVPMSEFKNNPMGTPMIEDGKVRALRLFTFGQVDGKIEVWYSCVPSSITKQIENPSP